MLKFMFLMLWAIPFLLAAGYGAYILKFYFSWDIMAYWLYGRYLYYKAGLLTTFISPGLPLIIGWLPSYNYAIWAIWVLSFSLFSFSGLRFCKKFNIPPFVFFSIFAFPMYMKYAVSNGTELLALSFLLLYLTEENGLFLGLSSLLRVGNVAFFLFPISRKKWKDTVLGLIPLSAIPLLSWLETGHPMMFFKQMSILSANHPNIPLMSLAILPFVLAKKDEISLLAISLLQFFSAPANSLRYLFFSSVPVSIMLKNRKFIPFLFVSIGIGMFIATIMMHADETSVVMYGIKGIQRVCRKISIPGNCPVLSDQWMIARYCGIDAYPLTDYLRGSDYAKIIWPNYIPGKCYKDVMIIGFNNNSII